MSTSSSFPFDVVVVTSPDPDAAPVQTLKPHLPEHVRLHCTGDPFGARCGSGGGTLAAIESSRSTNEESILIIHAGGESSRCPTQMVLGKAWTSLPILHDSAKRVVISNPTVLLVQVLSHVFSNMPKGSIVVAASDCLLHLPLSNKQVDWSRYNNSVLGVAVPAPLRTAMNHGVYCMHGGTVSQFLQKPSPTQMKETPHCVWNNSGQAAWIDTGVVAFLSGAADTLRSLANTMDCCTEGGLRRLYAEEKCRTESLEDFARRRALRVELYTHMMMASSSTDSFDAYLHACGQQDLPNSVLKQLYDALSPYPLNAMALSDGNFRHLGTSRELLEFYFQNEQEPHIVKRAQSFLPFASQDCVAINVVVEVESDCKIGEKSILEHSHLVSQNVNIGSECLLSGVRGSCDFLVIPNGMIFQMIPLSERNNQFVYMYLGLDDGIKSGSTMWGMPIEDIFRRTGLNRSDVWNDNDQHIVWKARIHPMVESENNRCEHEDVFYWITELQQRIQTHDDSDEKLSEPAVASLAKWKNLPRLSLSEIRQRADAVAEFEYREHLERNVLCETLTRHCQSIRDILMNRQNTECSIESVIGSFAATGCWSNEGNYLVIVLDKVMMDAYNEDRYDVCGRASMILSELFYNLSSTVEDKVPSIKGWRAEVNPLGVTDWDTFKHMFFVRDTTLNDELSSSALMKCANATERCASAMTQLCVTNPSSPRSLPRVAHAPVDTWVIATAPARIDLAGGWSDTPPICIEHGGAVCCVAVTVDGHKPLSCRCRLVSHGSGILLRSEGRDIKTGEIKSEMTVSLEKIGDLEGYRNPQSDCSLIKCALVYSGLVSGEKIAKAPDDDLSVYLDEFCGIEGIGLEIVTTSLLPHGSGMGTSSILGGCVLSALTKCVGIDTSGADLVHMVLMLEQMLSSGGGWQDQVGGLVGGAKLCTSHNSLPLEVNVEKICLAPSFEDLLNQRLLLAFTGQTRLAKNILQNVLRHWALRSKDVVDTVEELTSGAYKAKDGLQNQDLDGLADCLNAYWNQKKIMAGESSEPPVVHDILTELLARDLIQAGSLCGAGGGGFMVLLLKEGREPSEIRQCCRDEIDSRAIAAFTWHECRISQEGLSIVLCKNSDSDAFDMSWHQSST